MTGCWYRRRTSGCWYPSRRQTTGGCGLLGHRPNGGGNRRRKSFLWNQDANADRPILWHHLTGRKQWRSRGNLGDHIV